MTTETLYMTTKLLKKVIVRPKVKVIVTVNVKVRLMTVRRVCPLQT